MATTTNLDSLVINYLTQEQYDEAQQAGTLNANQLYLTPDTGNTYGTVTSVGIANATNGGLSISGSPVTSSGSITVGHSNVLSSAQTTQAVYPIQIDKNGHISAYGSAVTISDEKVKQENTTSSNTYRVLLSGGPNDTTSTLTSYKSTKLKFTPSTGELSVTGQVSSKGLYSYVTGATGYSGLSHDKSNYEITLYNSSENSGSGEIKLSGSSITFSRTPYGSSTAIEYIKIPSNSQTAGITVTGLKTPTSDSDAATKKYVDDSIGAIPAATDEKVKQTEKNDSYTKTILLGSDTTSDVTSGVIKTANLRYNDNGSIELFVGPITGNYAAYQSTGIVFNKPYPYELEIPTGLTNRKITFPSATGTIALTSDIPSVYSSTNTGGYLTMSTLPIYNGTVV